MLPKTNIAQYVLKIGTSTRKIIYFANMGEKIKTTYKKINKHMLQKTYMLKYALKNKNHRQKNRIFANIVEK